MRQPLADQEQFLVRPSASASRLRGLAPQRGRARLPPASRISLAAPLGLWQAAGPRRECSPGQAARRSHFSPVPLQRPRPPRPPRLLAGGRQDRGLRRLPLARSLPALPSAPQASGRLAVPQGPHHFSLRVQEPGSSRAVCFPRPQALALALRLPQEQHRAPSARHPVVRGRRSSCRWGRRGRRLHSAACLAAARSRPRPVSCDPRLPGAPRRPLAVDLQRGCRGRLGPRSRSHRARSARRPAPQALASAQRPRRASRRRGRARRSAGLPPPPPPSPPAISPPSPAWARCPSPRGPSPAPSAACRGLARQRGPAAAARARSDPAASRAPPPTRRPP